jgi:cytoskeletal protein RodZ
VRRQGGGFGFVVLLVVLAVVLYLALNDFKATAPAAIAIQKHNKARQAGEKTPSTESPSASADSWTPSAPSRPSLSTMDQKTSEHAAEVQGALSQTE